MSKIEIDLQKMSTLEQEIELLEKKKKTLESDLEVLSRECNSIKDSANKEVAQLKQSCESECQEKNVKADAILKKAESSLASAVKREVDSLVIEKQIKELDKKSKEFKETEKQLEVIKISCIEREKKADLLIKQYEKKLDELNKK